MIPQTKRNYEKKIRVRCRRELTYEKEIDDECMLRGEAVCEQVVPLRL